MVLDAVNAAPMNGKFLASLDGWLPAYVRASYRLSGHSREPTAASISAHRGLMMCAAPAPRNFAMLAFHVESGAVLRQSQAAGERRPGEGGTAERDLAAAFEELLSRARDGSASADELARDFRALRPLTAANGRCSRALWMWRMAHGSDADRRSLLTRSPSEVWPEPAGFAQAAEPRQQA